MKAICCLKMKFASYYEAVQQTWKHDPLSWKDHVQNTCISRHDTDQTRELHAKHWQQYL